MKNNVYLILLYVGSLIALVAFSDLARVKYLLREGNAVPGEVIALLPVKDDDGGVTYKSKISYVTIDGQTRTHVQTFSSSPPLHEIGQELEIIYHPEELKKVRVNSFWGLHRLTIILLCLSAPLLIISVSHRWYQSPYNRYAPRT